MAPVRSSSIVPGSGTKARSIQNAPGTRPEIAEVVRRFADVLFLVDTVSSMAAVQLDLDRWGVDVCFAGTQKAWGLPPGLSLCAVSERALHRSGQASGRGYYFDWRRHAHALERWQTPATPAISLLFQLESALDRIEREGPQVRYRRHRELQEEVLGWAARRGLRVLAREGYRSPTLTALFLSPGEALPVIAGMRRRGWALASGYGRFREDMIRIGHMGELGRGRLREALADLESALDQRPD